MKAHLLLAAVLVMPAIVAGDEPKKAASDPDAQRKEVFAALYQADAWAKKRAAQDFEGYGQDARTVVSLQPALKAAKTRHYSQAKSAIADHYKLSSKTLAAIEKDGFRKHWKLYTEPVVFDPVKFLGASPEEDKAKPSEPSAAPHNRQKTEHVKGYYRKDGKYVAPYTRRPKR